jgi:hypothetical protein
MPQPRDQKQPSECRRGDKTLFRERCDAEEEKSNENGRPRASADGDRNY